jgi:prepilin-type N-terminal cleavage/methylation domain-containing protein
MLMRYEKGMTLIEIVIVIAIIATLASVAIPTLITSLDVQDNKATKQSMDAVKTALLNYYRDLGEFPELSDTQKDWAGLKWGKDEFDDLDALVYNPFDPESSSLQEYLNSQKWNGPYIMASFKEDDYKYDAWGRPYFYQPGYGKPPYLTAMSFHRFGGTNTFTTELGGYGSTSENAVLLVSEGKVPGYGRKKMESGQSYTGWYGIINQEKLQEMTPAEIYPNDDEAYIPLIIDPRAERVDNGQNSYDDEKIEETKEMLNNLKTAIVSFVKDLGVVTPYQSSGAEYINPVALDSEYFSQFTNPLFMLASAFRGDPNESIGGCKLEKKKKKYKKK